MPIKYPPPRHTVEQFDNATRVVLPSKKNIFRIIWFCIWLTVWSYIIISLIVYVLAPMLIVFSGLAENVVSQQTDYSAVYFFVAFAVLFGLAFFALGSIVTYSLLWQIFGQEIIEIDSQVMSVSRKIFAWKKASEYSSESVNDLRVSIPQQAFFAPMRSLQYLLGQNGIIAFDYGAKIFRFGLEIDEAEAKQIISALKPHLPQQN